MKLNYRGLTIQENEYYMASGTPNSSNEEIQPHCYIILGDAVGVILPNVEGDFFAYHNGYAGSMGEWLVCEGLTGKKIAGHGELYEAVRLADQMFATYSTKPWDMQVDAVGENISPRYIAQ